MGERAQLFAFGDLICQGPFTQIGNKVNSPRIRPAQMGRSSLPFLPLLMHTLDSDSQLWLMLCSLFASLSTLLYLGAILTNLRSFSYRH